MTPLQKSKAEAKRKKAGLACAKNLAAASKSLSEYITACNECDDASQLRPNTAHCQTRPSTTLAPPAPDPCLPPLPVASA